ncbi:MAG: sensor histidine kinase [Lachnospiraceae bacterium]
MKKIHINSLIFKSIAIVLAGSIGLAFSLSLATLLLFQKVYINTFAETQSKVLDHIDNDLCEFMCDINNIMDEIDGTNEYVMSNEAEVFILGENEKNSIYSNFDEIWNSDVAAAARSNPGQIVCLYQERGFTGTSADSPVIIWAKAWSLDGDDTADMVGFITVKEKEIRDMYSHFISQNCDIILLNQDNEVVSTNNGEYLSEDSQEADALCHQIEVMEDKDVYQEDTNDQEELYLMQRLQSTNYKIVGIISPKEAFKEQFDIAGMILLISLITVITALIIIIIINRQTRPLSKIVCAAEIHALQMQINPHYMYNTLGSIKWLIKQGDADKSIRVINAFIAMMQNVISNSDEFISVEKEMENLENYVFINQTRYGESVKVEYYILPRCLKYQIPKMILQPLVENAFFHAFPTGRRGSIQIFAKEVKGNLRFEIVDNGVGMTTEQMAGVQQKKQLKGDHLTGIGIRNVDERIKLLYGAEYGIKIISRDEVGTTVTITLPGRVH